MQRLLGVLVVAASLGATTVGTSAVPAAAWTRFRAIAPHQDAPGLSEGVSVESIANYEVAAQWPGSTILDLLLERVPLDPGEALDGRDPDESGGGAGAVGALAQREGMHLLYVETGEVVLAATGEELTFRLGESVFVPGSPSQETTPGRWVSLPAPAYELRNDTGGCASVLRFSVFFSPPGRGAVPQAPSGPERGCGSYEFLSYTSTTYPWPADPPPELPVELFIYRVRWDTFAPLFSEPQAFAGAVMLVVESESLYLDVAGPAHMDPQSEFEGEVPAGEWFTLGAGDTFTGWGAPGASILVVGIAPADP